MLLLIHVCCSVLMMPSLHLKLFEAALDDVVGKEDPSYKKVRAWTGGLLSHVA